MRRLIPSLLCVLVLSSGCNGDPTEQTPPADPVEPKGEELGSEPIAYVGHGWFFDATGAQLAPTQAFVGRAQRWYRATLVAGLSSEEKKEFALFERRLASGPKLDGQAGLVVNQRALDWLAATSKVAKADPALAGKARALGYRLHWKLSERDEGTAEVDLVDFKLDPRIAELLKELDAEPGGSKAALVTTNSGQQYIDECAAAGVPIPPPIGQLDPLGTAGWRSLGFIPKAEQFIENTPAEFRVFESSAGMCAALPRYTNDAKTDVQFDGVICLSKTTSKVCFWDNQMAGVGFNFPAGTVIPIGVADLTVNADGLYQAGGKELEGGSGGVCTTCHAGENPYIIHPNSNLAANGTLLMGDLGDPPLNLPTFGPARYDPIVAASWPQNQLSQAIDVPAACEGCHTQGDAGRFPHLSTELTSYCTSVLDNAIARTMPPGNPGGEAGTAEVLAFRAWCGEPTTSGPSNRGDPHLTTTNGVRYDFQAAGEFTSLRNSASGFELQTRQSPVPTSFTPGANAYTGLASCVSLNTAAALRLGERRVSYQPETAGAGAAEQMVLRVDGKVVTLAATGLDLGGGDRIDPVASGGIDVLHADGTRVLITPTFWASEGYWYLNVEVLDTPAREGTMGYISSTSWLPAAPDGTSFGAAPAAISDRHTLLNKTFADAWRVRAEASLFDYAAGTSTDTFTDRAWPPAPGEACTQSAITKREPVKGMSKEKAVAACRSVKDEAANQDCVFDLTVLGDPRLAAGWQQTLRVRADAEKTE